MVKCTPDCKNKDGVLTLIFITESDVKPPMSCGPCGNKEITDISLIDTQTITESV